MVKVLKFDQIMQDMKEAINLGKNMELGSFYGLMDLFMKENSVKIILKALEFINELMGGFIKATERAIKWMEKVDLLGVMADLMKESTLMIKNMDMAFLNGLMGKNMKAIDLMVNNMEEEFSMQLMGALKKANGRKEKRLNGYNCNYIIWLK